MKPSSAFELIGKDRGFAQSSDRQTAVEREDQNEDRQHPQRPSARRTQGGEGNRGEAGFRFSAKRTFSVREKGHNERGAPGAPSTIDLNGLRKSKGGVGESDSE